MAMWIFALSFANINYVTLLFTLSLHLHSIHPLFLRTLEKCFITNANHQLNTEFRTFLIDSVILLSAKKCACWLKVLYSRRAACVQQQRAGSPHVERYTAYINALQTQMKKQTSRNQFLPYSVNKAWLRCKKRFLAGTYVVNALVTWQSFEIA